MPAAARRQAPRPGFQERRKEDSRQRLLGAAMALFCERGYFAVTVEEIAIGAGVSRMTFYRHFAGKADVAAELFRDAAEEALPRYLRIGEADHADRAVVLAWLKSLFEADRANRRALRVFIQATADNGFTERAQQLIATLIERLGQTIPAFAVAQADPAQRRAWLEAWLLIYEILDQSNHAALDSGVAADPLVIEILADRFLRFVLRPVSAQTSKSTAGPSRPKGRPSA